MRRGHQATAGALEQHHAELRLQFANVPSHRGLARGELARRTHETAPVQRGQKGADQRPVEIAGIHS